MHKKIFKKLESKNLNPFYPGQHQGKCTEPYTVIREGAQIPSPSGRTTGQKIIDIILFTPGNSYLQMEEYKKQVGEALREIKGLRKTGIETPIITDDDKEAYTSSQEYVIHKKMEG